MHLVGEKELPPCSIVAVDRPRSPGHGKCGSAVVVLAGEIDQVESDGPPGKMRQLEVIPVRLSIAPVLIGLPLDRAPQMRRRNGNYFPKASAFEVRQNADLRKQWRQG